jgi:hypothetical protein
MVLDQSAGPVRRSAATFFVILSGLLQACGGGGNAGESGEDLRSLRVSADRNMVVLERFQDDFGQPIETLTLSVDPVPREDLILVFDHTENAVTFVDLGTTTERTADVLIFFRSPDTLLPGVYSDLVTLRICSDESCSREVSGSPLQVSTQYTVRASQNQSPTPTPLPGEMSDRFSIRSLQLNARELVWHPQTQRIFAAVPSVEGINGNSVAVIDPLSGQVESFHFVGSEPDQLALSDDGEFLYVGLRGASTVERMRVPEMNVDLSIPMGRGRFNEPLIARDIAVRPGVPETLAVSRERSGGGTEDLQIFQGAQLQSRPDATEFSGDSPGPLVWSPDGADLYSRSVFGGDLHVYRLEVDGLRFITTFRDAFQGFGGALQFDGGALISGVTAVDPATGTRLGRYETNDIPFAGVADSEINRFFLIDEEFDGTFNLRVTAFNRRQFTPLESILLGEQQASPLIYSMIRWGSQGLAFSLGSGSPEVPPRVLILEGPFVSGLEATALHKRRWEIDNSVE